MWIITTQFMLWILEDFKDSAMNITQMGIQNLKSGSMKLETKGKSIQQINQELANTKVEQFLSGTPTPKVYGSYSRNTLMGIVEKNLSTSQVLDRYISDIELNSLGQSKTLKLQWGKQKSS